MGRVGVQTLTRCIIHRDVHRKRVSVFRGSAVKVQFPRSRDAKCVHLIPREWNRSRNGECMELHIYTGSLPGAERSDIPRMGVAMDHTCTHLSFRMGNKWSADVLPEGDFMKRSYLVDGIAFLMNLLFNLIARKCLQQHISCYYVITWTQ